MKKLFPLMLFAFVIIITSCEKNDFKSINSTISENIDGLKSINQKGKFSRDIMVFDKTGENSVCFRLSSNEINLIDDFINSKELTIEVSSNKMKEYSYIPKVIKNANNFNQNYSHINTNKREKEAYDLVLSKSVNRTINKLVIENISSNFKDGITDFSLVVEPKPNSLKTITYIDEEFSTSGYFIGITKLAWDNYPINVALGHYYYSGGFHPWLDSEETLTLSSYSAYNTRPYEGGDWTGLYLAIYNTDSRVRYSIAYSSYDYRGRDCSGIANTSFDGSNCRVSGYSPSGTTPSWYYEGTGNTYYRGYSLPSNNQCVYPFTMIGIYPPSPSSPPPHCEDRTTEYIGYVSVFQPPDAIPDIFFTLGNKWYVKANNILY
ncbi:MAG: hypothetical protein KKG99_03460 [Bacteroidetes bacterium]|nr:hypothetical protein [Bacteroidota bacterium]